MKKLSFGLLLLVACLFISGCGCQKEKSFTITFDSNGGSKVSTQTVEENGLVTKPTDPTKDGYSFSGWFLDLNDNTAYDFGTKVTKNITLYAKWSENQKITLNTTATTITIGKSQTIKATLTNGIAPTDLIWKSSDESIAKVDANGEVTALKEGNVIITVSTKDGLTTANCSVTVRKEEVALNVTISGDKTVEVGKTVTLKAKVTPSSTIINNTTWKSSNKNIATVSNKGVVKGIAAGTVNITVTVTDNAGNIKNAVVKVTVKNVPTQNDDVIPPVEKTPEYTVSFNSNGGTNVAKQTVEKNSHATNPKTPTRSGYTFDGWYLNDVKFNFNTPITKDITLTAKWIKNPDIYTIKYIPYDSYSPTGVIQVFKNNGTTSIAFSELLNASGGRVGKYNTEDKGMRNANSSDISQVVKVKLTDGTIVNITK